MSSPVPESFPEPANLQSPTFGGYYASSTEIQGVTFWPRAVARLLDDAVHFVIAVVTGGFFGVLLAIVAAMNHQAVEPIIARQANSRFLLIAFSLLGLVAFHTIMEGMHGSSPGKLAFRMVVVSEEGRPCRMKAALIRSLAFYIDALFFGVIGYMAMRDTVTQQRHGDNWAHTVVCKRSAVKPEYLHGAGRWWAAFLLAGMADSAILAFGYALSIMP